ncbi:DEAD/DEAH box helicase [Enterobacter kobei]|uniref:DEAD/DEAH box helicase n=1 Tax=Enterobacter kobei TaxID=208224 RepID=UPI002A837BA3|nr:DEAD/DEAH box helicase [Enterobacter kobei]
MEINNDIQENELFDFTFKEYQCCSRLLRVSPEKGREMLISILECKNNYDNRLNEMLGDLIDSAGFYPYLEKEKITLTSTQQLIREKYHHSNNIIGISYHEEQKYYYDIILSGKNLILSAPTSFGKSLLIEEIIASNIYNNILIIQPTLALLDETRRKIKKYKDRYELIIRTGQEYSFKKGNIFLLTAERVSEYQNLPMIDFLIVDEFYKVSSTRDDERHQSLNNALLKIFNLNPKQRFYFSGPNIDGVSEGFLNKYSSLFSKTTYSLVRCNVHNIYEKHFDKFGPRGSKARYKENVLFELLWEKRDEQTLVYCSSPARARRISKNFTDYINEKQGGSLSYRQVPLVEWIEKNINEKWSLIDSLKNGIAFHDGSLPRHMTSSLIDYFNEKLLSVIFCTSTIIEGVNSNAKNIIYFDSTKGKNPIDYFDYSNIKGRAGRLMEHFTGNVYNFEIPPAAESIYIDIPFIDQEMITAEVLINIKEEDVKNTESNEYLFLKSLDNEVRYLFSMNQINIHGQKNLLDFLIRNHENIHDKLFWTLTPKYKQLEFCIELCWNFLLNKDDVPGNLSAARMTKLTYDYASSQSINRVIENMYTYNLSLIKRKTKEREQKALDEAIRDGFYFLRQWFQYKLPKLLLVLNELQSYVAKLKNLAAGNYNYYCSLIENDFIDERYAMLIEYGVPKTAISSLLPFIEGLETEEKIVKKIINDRLYESKALIEYERDLIKKNIKD